MTEIFNKFVQEDITPDGYYVLHCIKEKIVPNNFVNNSLQVTKLKRYDWLNENLTLTNKSHLCLQSIVI